MGELNGSSSDKVLQLRQELLSAAPADEETAQLLALAQVFGPQLEGLLPLNDPGRLDELLLAGASLFLRLRSDDAEPAVSVVRERELELEPGG